MKKKTKVVRLLSVLMMGLVIAITLTACGAKDGYEGVYECTYYSVNGSSKTVSSVYEYYTVTLDGKGKLETKYKLKTSPYTEGEGSSKYKIDGTKFIEIVGNARNEYYIEDNVITMTLETQGMTIVAKFTRTVEENTEEGVS